MSTFKLPDLGEGLAEAEILQWHVKVGDHVEVDQPMVSVETAKAVVEVPVPYGGVVKALRGAPGDILLTGAPLIEFDAGTVVGRMPETCTQELIESAAVRHRDGAATNDGRKDRQRGRAVPAARALARRLSLDLQSINGSGRDGLITLDDVLARVHPADATPRSAVPSPNVAARPLRGVRRTMAQSMTLSRDQVSGSTVCDDADLHGWIQRGDYMLRLMRAMINACTAEPALNAWYDSTTTSRTLFAHIDLAIAIDTPAGLIVPVVRNVQSKTALQLRDALLAQKDAAHQRRTATEDLRGFTLMLSNFGTLAGRYGIPLVVPPAVAILGAGKVREDAVAIDGAVHAHRRMPLSLSFDHRCVTGGEACRFLAAVIADLEKPD
jgi:2-oxoisovalerate dehydrogenase E2 component (dihydrolipoyl transacylase)